MNSNFNSNYPYDGRPSLPEGASDSSSSSDDNDLKDFIRQEIQSNLMKQSMALGLSQMLEAQIGKQTKTIEQNQITDKVADCGQKEQLEQSHEAAPQAQQNDLKISL